MDPHVVTPMLLKTQLSLHQKETQWPGRSRQRKGHLQKHNITGKASRTTEVLCRRNVVTGSRVGEGVGKGPETKLHGGGPHATQEAQGRATARPLPKKQPPEGACRAPKVPPRPDGVPGVRALTGMQPFAREKMHLLPDGFT